MRWPTDEEMKVLDKKAMQLSKTIGDELIRLVEHDKDFMYLILRAAAFHIIDTVMAAASYKVAMENGDIDSADAFVNGAAEAIRNDIINNWNENKHQVPIMDILKQFAECNKCQAGERHEH